MTASEARARIETIAQDVGRLVDAGEVVRISDLSRKNGDGHVWLIQVSSREPHTPMPVFPGRGK